MTSDPAAPNAPAVYLLRQETVDDKIHFHTLYARIKVLTEKGKDYADVEIPPYQGRTFIIRDIQGRTIHSDGTVIPFTGKPIEKLLMKQGNVRVMTKVFSLPDVQVGSIIEYSYTLAYDDNLASSPRWIIQQPIFVHKAHYHFVPTTRELISNSEHGNVVNALLYSQLLPVGVKVREGLDGYDLTIENVPALPDEEFMPPMQSLSYRVLFYYSGYHTEEEFWKSEGKYWSKNLDRFARPSDKLHSVVQELAAPGDTDEQKARKIYAAVMKLENTSFTRQHSVEENKAEGLKVKTADDIWDQKRGNDDEITRLFIAMARAAGLKAYGMIVTNRDTAILIKEYLDWNQLDDEIAIVSIGGKEVYFDPGERYCEFGKLHWKHTMTSGVRQIEGGTALAITPPPSYKDSQTGRIAELTIDSNGQVKGYIRITFTGGEALYWRQHALRVDEDQEKKDFEDDLQGTMPAGLIVKMNHFIGLTDSDNALMAIVDASGSMGTATGKRVFLPGNIFEANAKPMFALEKRESPVYLHYPSIVEDHTNIILPAGFAVESVPKDAVIPFPTFAEYIAKYKTTDAKYMSARRLTVANLFYKKEEYSSLKDFFAKTTAQDLQQSVLQVSSVATVSPATAVSKAQ